MNYLSHILADIPDRQSAMPRFSPLQPTISVVMPAYQAAYFLPRSLPPLLALAASGEVLEVIVVDDASTDGTAEIARDLGARVLRLEQNSGPAGARNHALSHVQGQIVWFVDSDVVTGENATSAIRAAFDTPGLVAVFGCYDAEPADQHWFSRYKNLMHRYYHLRSSREVHTFWSGFGAVRRDVLLEVGGFDPNCLTVEDIELGHRISQAGHRIEIEAALTGKHLKAWRIPGALQSDIFGRAIPWARLLIAGKGEPRELNVDTAERFRAAVAVGALLLLLAAAFSLVPGWIAGAAFILSLLLNLRLGMFLLRHGGPMVAAGGVLYHQFYYLYASGAYLFCLAEHYLMRRGKSRPAPDDRSQDDPGGRS
ncbi:glycosyltransferase family 2 protein [Paracoccus ravus]|uniref:glycosyltransferase family 2 protein n=1 Tax=Paracoccus ravus TaxID=2447760 RepID=UPI00106E6A0A|nr:glycosyltransferase family 2 protein [Paracoccus ravus]